MSTVTDRWNEFREVLSGYPNALSSLNDPCTFAVLSGVESFLGFALPLPLRELLALNNGQRADTIGLFKSISGWDVYSRLHFLDAESIAQAHHHLCEDDTLRNTFGVDEIPFALNRAPNSIGEAYTIHRQTHAIRLLWTLAYDPFLPAEWQLWKFARGSSLSEFLEVQTSFYQ